MSLGVDIRGIRRNRGLLMREVAEAVDVPESALSVYERGQRRPTDPIAKRIADFYGYTVTEVWPDPSPDAESEVAA